MVSGFARFAVTAAVLGLITACGGSPETTPESSPSPTEEEGASVPVEEGVPAADFDAPLVPGEVEEGTAEGASPVRVARLIAPTNPDARARQTEAELKKTRTAANRDPFSIPINVSPSVATPRTAAEVEAARAEVEQGQEGTGPIAIPRQAPPIVTNPPAPPPSARRSSQASRSSSGSGSSSSSSSASSSKPSPEPAQPARPAGPPAPSGALGIRVTGVVQVGNDYKIVLEVPGEPTARYVSVGDRLSGDVLVKRVELDDLLDPIVVFEQFGQEVLKPVGEEPSEQVAIAPNTGSEPRF
ncbi:MAG: hypothetical protein AAF685_15425 [Cyanobacteria bacterium P01_C01_bin.89]